MDGPNFLLGTLPITSPLPIQRIEVCQDSRSIHNKIVLAVIDQDLNSPQHVNHLIRIAFADVRLESIVNGVRTRHIVDISGNAETGARVVEKCGKSEIHVLVLSEIKSAHSAPIFIPSVVVISQKIEVRSCLNHPKDTFL